LHVIGDCFTMHDRATIIIIIIITNKDKDNKRKTNTTALYPWLL